MAQKVQLDRTTFACAICLDLVKHPVTIPCGHSYCMSCIKIYWDKEDKKIHSCPQCRQTFTPRPGLVKNTMLAVLVEELKKTGLEAAAADHCYAGDEDVACDVCTGGKLTVIKSCLLKDSQQKIKQRIQSKEKDVKVLQQEVEAISRSADEAVEKSDETFTELIRFMEKRQSDVKQQIRSQQQTEVSRVKELQKELEQEITELRRKDTELEKLSHTQDHNQFLHNYPSVSKLSEDTDSSSINIRRLHYFKDVTAAVSQLRDKLQHSVSEECSNISLMVTQVHVLLSKPPPEPQTRDEFLKYSHDITLDPNTANTNLLLSNGNRRATCMNRQQNYPPHPERFIDTCQVLSRDSLTGRCYWEVECYGDVCVAVSYKKGLVYESGFGKNDKSWALDYFVESCTFRHNNIGSCISGPVSSRIGVYLDHSAGFLSFYSVSDTMTLLHRVQTTFTQPLYVGLWFYCDVSTAHFPKLTQPVPLFN